jgi:hypothetical protein
MTANYGPSEYVYHGLSLIQLTFQICLKTACLVVSAAQVRISRGIHGLPNVSLGLAMPYHSTPCRRLPLKQPYGRLKVDGPQDGWLGTIKLPP